MSLTEAQLYDKEVMYKLGAIETQVASIGQRIDVAIKGLEDKIDETNLQNHDKYIALEKRIDRNQTRLDELQRWKEQQMTRLVTIVSGITIFWAFFGALVETRIGQLF